MEKFERWGGTWRKIRTDYYKFFFTAILFIFFILSQSIDVFAVSPGTIYLCDSTGAVLTANDLKGHTVTAEYSIYSTKYEKYLSYSITLTEKSGVVNHSGTEIMWATDPPYSTTYINTSNKIPDGTSYESIPYSNTAYSTVSADTCNTLNSRIYAQYGTDQSTYPSSGRIYASFGTQNNWLNHLYIDGQYVSVNTEYLGYIIQHTHKTNFRADYARVCQSLIGHTHNTNTVHYTNSGQRIYNGHAQHYVHKWYSCDANDGYTKDNGEYYYEDCYDKDDNGSCDFCGRKRVWVNINVCTPEGNEDTSGGTAKFDVSWYDNLALGATQNHSATQVSDQPYSKVWVGTQIWLANINMQKSYLYLSGVSGATQSGNQYYYTVQDASHSIDINTAYKSYALTINPNGGTLNVSDSSITKNSDGTARATVTYNSGNYNILGITASRTHYIMDGFYTAASGGTKLWNNGGDCLNDGTYWKNNKWSYAGGVTAYAHWSDAPGYHNGQPIVYTITYNLFPKNGNGTKITDPGNPTTYTIETPTFTLKNPSATGYDFEGWYGSGTNGSKGVTIVQGSMGDLHFTADWLPTKDTSKSSSKDQNLPYVKTTPIIENTYKFAS